MRVIFYAEPKVVNAYSHGCMYSLKVKITLYIFIFIFIYITCVDSYSISLITNKSKKQIPRRRRKIISFLNYLYSPPHIFSHLVSFSWSRQKDEKQKPKSIPDHESNGAAWLSVKELMDKGTKKNCKIRGTEMLDWGRYLDKGGWSIRL